MTPPPVVVLVVVSAACFSPVIFFDKPTRVVTVLVHRAVPCATVLSIAKLVIETSFDLS